MILEFKRLSEKATEPKKAHPYDAGFDLTCTSVVLTDDYISYKTGIAVNIPKDHVGILVARSSSCKYDLLPASGVGIIDAEYQGELEFRFVRTRETNIKQYVEGDKMCQLVVVPLAVFELQEVDIFMPKSGGVNRGTGGFGSSGV